MMFVYLKLEKKNALKNGVLVPNRVREWWLSNQVSNIGKSNGKKVKQTGIVVRAE